MNQETSAFVQIAGKCENNLMQKTECLIWKGHYSYDFKGRVSTSITCNLGYRCLLVCYCFSKHQSCQGAGQRKGEQSEEKAYTAFYR